MIPILSSTKPLSATSSVSHPALKIGQRRRMFAVDVGRMERSALRMLAMSVRTRGSVFRRRWTRLWRYSRAVWMNAEFVARSSD
jgi:hypothetical protein